LQALLRSRQTQQGRVVGYAASPLCCEDPLLSQRAKGIMRSIVPRSARNWLRSPRKSMEWLWDSVSFSIGATKELALLPDWRVICHPRVYKVFSLSQLTDPDQSEEFRNFVRYCDASMRLFDIGASYGAFSLVAAHFGGTAIAVEPSPIATRFIRAECQLNGFEGNIRVVEACAGEMICEVEMLSSGVFSDGYFRMAPGIADTDAKKGPPPVGHALLLESVSGLDGKKR
jgi:hypothetical protein